MAAPELQQDKLRFAKDLGGSETVCPEKATSFPEEGLAKAIAKGQEQSGSANPPPIHLFV